VNILFVHQNMPGQFKHLAPLLARDPKNRVVFVTARKDAELPNIGRVVYEVPKEASKETHQYLRRLENAVRYGQQVVRALQGLAAKGFVPDLVIAHPGWGEALYIKDVFPNTRLINFCEFYYHGRGLDVGFDPEDAADLDSVCRARTRNAHLLSSLESCDAGVSPTQWQKSTHPVAFHDKIDVIFDGINPAIVKPIPGAYVTVGAKTFRRGDKVVTYLARNLEPYRGFRTFMRSIPHIQRMQPDADILIVGGEDVSYGAAPRDHKTWRAAMEAEVAFDPSRVHFLGKLPYAQYLSVLQLSAAHIYLTYPFVLSWSCVEAMCAGALLIASNTQPVRELVRDGENGLLTDFFDAEALAARVSDALDNQERYAPLREAARATVLDGYTIETCLPKWLSLIDRVMKAPVTNRLVFA
jgi:glycosyltransferase involved in cell wall biosynthesis